jgi:ABC-2 type transport system ATP-binding protein
MASLFRARRLVKNYGSTVALAGVDIEVGESEIVGLLGPNGAGKSTLVKIACGLVGPTSGTVEVCGAAAGSTTARSSLGYLAELFRFQPWLRAHEVLLLHQQLARSTGGEVERNELLALVGLADAADKRVDAMSKGMQQRLGIAQALIGSPRLLMLDEPTSALDPAGRRAVRVILEQIRDRGISVLLNSHLLGEVEYVCDRVVILLAGEVIAHGSPGDLAGPRGVVIETGSGIREFPDASRDEIPELVERLIAEGQSIYSVKVARPTLEDVYLEAVKGATG